MQLCQQQLQRDSSDASISQSLHVVPASHGVRVGQVDEVRVPAVPSSRAAGRVELDGRVVAHGVDEDGPVVVGGDVSVVGARVTEVQLDHRLTAASRVVDQLTLVETRTPDWLERL